MKSLYELKLGSYTNRKKISELLDINLTGWSAVGINRVDDKVLLWVNLDKATAELVAIANLDQPCVIFGTSDVLRQ